MKNDIENDIEIAFNALMNWAFIQYRGYRIERTKTQFKIFGELFPTLYLAKKKIDLRYAKIEKAKGKAGTGLI